MHEPYAEVGGGHEVFGLGGEYLGAQIHYPVPVDSPAGGGGTEFVDFCLQEGEFRFVAGVVSCRGIAGDGCSAEAVEIHSRLDVFKNFQSFLGDIFRDILLFV